MYYGTIDQPVTAERLQNAAAYQSHSPELISRDQFKLILMQQFRVNDVKLSNSLFMVADEKRKGALDVRELFGNILFWLKGEHDLKWALFFDIFNQNVTDADAQVAGGGVSVYNINKVVTDALKIFKETFFLAKTAADRMNTAMNGQISQDEFKQFCAYNPQAIDFIARLTLGAYPPSEEMLAYTTMQMNNSQPAEDSAPNANAIEPALNSQQKTYLSPYAQLLQSSGNTEV